MLELVALQGLLAHQRGEWFDRLNVELRRTRDVPEVATALFDGYLCPAEFMLYGATPYAEVIELCSVATGHGASAAGALRAVAFATEIIGEAALLSGDLDLAALELQQSIELHHEIAATGGEAAALQRLAEVHLARGDDDEANRLLRQALPLARWSAIALHLLQRIFGTMILAAPDPASARAVVDRAEATLGHGRRLPVLRHHARDSGGDRVLPRAATCPTRTATSKPRSARPSCGRARPGKAATAEAKAHVAAANRRPRRGPAPDRHRRQTVHDGRAAARRRAVPKPGRERGDTDRRSTASSPTSTCHRALVTARLGRGAALGHVRCRHLDRETSRPTGSSCPVARHLRGQHSELQIPARRTRVGRATTSERRSPDDCRGVGATFVVGSGCVRPMSSTPSDRSIDVQNKGRTGMPEAETHRRELKNTGYEIFIGILSVLSIFNLVLLYAIEDDGLDTVLFFMNAILSAIFLIDFTYRLFTAESKTHYFFRMFGWADLLASLPFQQVKILRVFRLVRVFRLLAPTASRTSPAACSRTAPEAPC